MANFINIAAVHFRLPSGSAPREEVLRDLRRSFEQLRGSGIDLVAVCEGVESRGQSPEQAESRDSPGEIGALYQEFAQSNRCVVAGSLKWAEEGKVYNSVVLGLPSGELRPLYHKRFLTGGELQKGLAPGTAVNACDAGKFRIAAAVCFDLNFTESLPDYLACRPDILVFPSMFHGGFLQSYWAYQLRCFFVSACKDCDSRVVDPLGRCLTWANEYTALARCRINLDRFVMHLDANLERFAEILRRYGDRVTIDIAPDLCTAVLYSNAEDTTAVAVAREFELTSLDDYLQMSRSANELRRPAP